MSDAHIQQPAILNVRAAHSFNQTRDAGDQTYAIDQRKVLAMGSALTNKDKVWLTEKAEGDKITYTVTLPRKSAEATKLNVTDMQAISIHHALLKMAGFDDIETVSAKKQGSSFVYSASHTERLAEVKAKLGKLYSDININHVVHKGVLDEIVKLANQIYKPEEDKLKAQFPALNNVFSPNFGAAFVNANYAANSEENPEESSFSIDDIIAEFSQTIDIDAKTANALIKGTTFFMYGDVEEKRNGLWTGTFYAAKPKSKLSEMDEKAFQIAMALEAGFIMIPAEETATDLYKDQTYKYTIIAASKDRMPLNSQNDMMAAAKKLRGMKPEEPGFKNFLGKFKAISNDLRNAPVSTENTPSANALTQRDLENIIGTIMTRFSGGATIVNNVATGAQITAAFKKPGQSDAEAGIANDRSPQALKNRAVVEALIQGMPGGENIIVNFKGRDGTGDAYLYDLSVRGGADPNILKDMRDKFATAVMSANMLVVVARYPSLSADPSHGSKLQDILNRAGQNYKTHQGGAQRPGTMAKMPSVTLDGLSL